MRRHQRALICGLVTVLIVAGGAVGYWNRYVRFTPVISYSNDMYGAAVSADGRSMTVAVDPYVGGPDTTEDLAVVSTGQTVEVRVRIATTRPQAPARYPNSTYPRAYVTMTATLASALGTRRLIDGSGRTIPSFGGKDLLIPPAAAWTEQQSHDLFPLITIGSPTSRLVGVERGYASTSPPGAEFTLIEQPQASATNPPIPDGTPVTVRGTTGSTKGGTVTWVEGTQRITISANYQATVPQLVAFADSLR